MSHLALMTIFFSLVSLFHTLSLLSRVPQHTVLFVHSNLVLLNFSNLKALSHFLLALSVDNELKENYAQLWEIS